jgi:Fur family ferric uptake transcriptional regulator
MQVDGARQLDVFRRFLRDRNLPLTQQREAVAAVVFFADGHLSVDDIEHVLSERRTRVGKATVYRTLALLERSGLVHEHDFGEGFKRYEPASGQTRHGHLICRSCGRVSEFTHERLERMVALIAEAASFRHEQHELEVYGRCQDCQHHDAAFLVNPSNGTRDL